MGELRERMHADLRIAGYSPITTKIYLLYARQFARFHMRSPEEAGLPEIRAFLLHLAERPVSPGTMRQVRAALTFLFNVTLGRPTEVAHLPTQRPRRRVPVALSGTEVGQLLSCVRKERYRLPLLACYPARLRIGEACRLRPEDIDSKRQLLRVEQGKGKKDRFTLLSRRFLIELRSYWFEHRPQGPWLFLRPSGGTHVNPDSVRLVFRKAALDAGIRKHVTPYCLRAAAAFLGITVA
jgi:integrase/recombinase XerD